MADVDIQCMSCSNQITVSDVVDVTKLRCRACGGEFMRSDAAPADAGPKPEEKRRSLMGKSGPAPAVNVAAAAADQDASPQAEANRVAWSKLNNPEARAEVQRQSSRMYSALTWKAWLTFIITGALAGTFRYSGLVPWYILEQAKIYEAIAVAAFYILIVLKAFQDSVFQGILCFLLPPYAFYYVLTNSDDFYLRAVLMGLLVGIGQDAGLIYYKWLAVWLGKINAWIASGG